MALSTGRTATSSVTTPSSAPPASARRNPTQIGIPMRRMKSEPRMPPTIPRVPAVKLNTLEALNITL